VHIDARCSKESLAASEAQSISVKVILVPTVVVVVVAARLGIIGVGTRSVVGGI
jgi:hypothetical protein